MVKTAMLGKARSRPDLLLLLSLLVVIVMHPVLDHGDVRTLILGVLMFVPVVLATVRLSQIKDWLWPTVVLMSGSAVFGAAGALFPNPALIGTKWIFLTAFFGLAVVGLFSYLKNARTVTDAHLYTAVSIYLLLGFTWFALYSAIDLFYPGSILRSSTAMADRPSELLYFSLVTLTTIGYGDIVPLHGEVRMLAALEGVIGVLYIAITVALLVSGYKRRDESRES
jgi:Ion channel